MYIWTPNLTHPLTCKPSGAPQPGVTHKTRLNFGMYTPVPISCGHAYDRYSHADMHNMIDIVRIVGSLHMFMIV